MDCFAYPPIATAQENHHQVTKMCLVRRVGRHTTYDLVFPRDYSVLSLPYPPTMGRYARGTVLQVTSPPHPDAIGNLGGLYGYVGIRFFFFFFRTGLPVVTLCMPMHQKEAIIYPRYDRCTEKSLSGTSHSSSIHLSKSITEISTSKAIRDKKVSTISKKTIHVPTSWYMLIVSGQSVLSFP